MRRVLLLAMGRSAAYAFAGCLMTVDAGAAGFYLSEVGTPGSLGTAGVGNATNMRGPESAWANPASMTEIDTPLAAAGMTAIFPVVEFAYKFSDRVDVGFGGSLLYAGEGALDQTAQGVRVVGDFDTNILLFLGGTMRYRF